MGDLHNCGVAAETKVETPEGPMTIRACAGKSIPVLTRNAENQILFRMMLDVRKIADQHHVLKITLETGDAFRVAPEQLLLRADMTPVVASRVTPGLGLFPAFHYPLGYRFLSDGGEERTSERALKVAKVQSGGTAEVYALGVNETGCFFLAAGVLCRAEG
jgi:hypothetical protein